jgi:flagellar FliL protein
MAATAGMAATGRPPERAGSRAAGESEEESAAASEAAAAGGPLGRLRQRLAGLGRRRLILLAAPLVLAATLGAAGLLGAFDPLLLALGLSQPTGPYRGPPVYFDLPEIVVDLDTPPGALHLMRAAIVLELASPEDKAMVKALLPRIEDTILSRLRALTPADLKGTAQSYELRDELLQRVRVALGGEQVRGVYFRDLLVR